MADKILRVVNGETQGLVIPTVSGGAEDAGKPIGADANGKLDASFLPNDIGADNTTVLASEALVAGDFISLWDDAGTTKARKADNTDSAKKADGFVKAPVASGANAVVYTEGSNDQLTGLAIGTRYFLGTNGGVTAIAPSAVNSIIQHLGNVKNATTIRFEQKDYIKNV